MIAQTWTCDGCGWLVALPQEIVMADEFLPAAVRHVPTGRPAGWEEFADDRSVRDLCPDCQTPEVIAASVIRAAEAAVMREGSA